MSTIPRVPLLCSSKPANPNLGDIWFDTVKKVAYVWMGNRWNLVARKSIQIFLLGVEVDEQGYDEGVISKLVPNYVNSAIKQYDKLLGKHERRSFFTGGSIPKYQIAQVDLSKKDDAMRDIIFMIKSIRDGDRDRLFSPILPDE